MTARRYVVDPLARRIAQRSWEHALAGENEDAELLIEAAWALDRAVAIAGADGGPGLEGYRKLARKLADTEARLEQALVVETATRTPAPPRKVWRP